MPELPDIELYLHALRPRISGQRLEAVRLTSPFLVRSVDPPHTAAVGQTVRGLRRLGKRVVWEFDDELFYVFHLMIAGRFQWKARGTSVPKRLGLAAFDWPTGTLMLTEAGSKRRAALHVVRGEPSLAALEPGSARLANVCPPPTCVPWTPPVSSRLLNSAICTAASATLPSASVA